jgi:putative oxidoreductase
MIFPQLAQFTDIALLLLRLMIGIVFMSSGYNHLKDPATRSKDVGMSKSVTIFLGAAELAGGRGVIVTTGGGNLTLTHLSSKTSRSR